MDSERKIADLVATLGLGNTLVDGTGSLRPAPRTGRVDPLDLPLLSIAVGPDAVTDTATVTTQPAGAGSTPEFQLVGLLGEGGMGVVHLARQNPLDREVAIKGVRGEAGAATENGLSLVHEAVVTGSLGHPNVVPVHALGRDARGLPLLVMKRVVGVAWRSMITDASHPAWRDVEVEGESDRLEWHVRVLMQVARAIHFAHSRGILHRDLKPDNVMIGAYGEVYLVDWGLALHLTDVPAGPPGASEASSGDRPRRSPQVVGTPAYMAPEMAAGETHRLGPWTDVYLLGAMLHEVLTGRPPHQGPLPAALLSAYRSLPATYGPAVPTELGAVARRAMAADPAQRHPGADGFVRALERFLRQRGAFQLSREAGERFTELERQLAAPAGQVDPVQIYRLFGECRFGLQQALRQAPDQQPIRDVLETCVGRMVRHELDQRHPEAAAALLAEMTTPPPALWAEVEALREAELARGQELEALRQAQHEQDLGVGARARGWVALVVAMIFNGLMFLYVQSVGGHKAMTLERGVLASSGFLVSAVLGGFIARRSLFQNAVSRRMALGFVLVAAGMAVHNLIGLLSRPSVEQQMVAGLMILSTGTLTLAATLDWRLAGASLWFAAGSLTLAALPGRGGPVIPLAIFGGIMLVALAWFRGARKT